MKTKPKKDVLILNILGFPYEFIPEDSKEGKRIAKSVKKQQKEFLSKKP